MFIPNRVIFEKDSLNYDLGKNLYDYFSSKDDIEIIEAASNRIKSHIPGDTLNIQ